MRHVVSLAIVLVAAPAVAGELRDLAGVDTVEPAPPEVPSTSAIRVGDLIDNGARRRIDRVDATVTVLRTRVVVALAIAVRGPDDTAVHTGAIELAVPAGARATGLQLSAGGAASPGEVMIATDARATFDRAVEQLRDPALLEWTRGDGDRDVLTLRIAPLTPVALTATVTLELPRGAGAGRVVVDTRAPSTTTVTAAAGAADGLTIAARRGKARRGSDDGAAVTLRAGRRAAPITIGFGAATGGAWFDEPPASTTILGPSLSLLTGTPPEAADAVARGRCRIIVTCGLVMPVEAPSRGSRAVRRTVKLYLPRVEHCFQQALQRDWASEGTLTGSWAIDDAGVVQAATVTGAGDDALRACVAGVIGDMKFSPSHEGLTQVHYPFTFAVGAETRRARAAAAEPTPEPLAIGD